MRDDSLSPNGFTVGGEGWGGSGSDVVHVTSSNRNVSGRSFINQIDMGGGNNQCYVTGSALGTASVNRFYGNGGDDLFVISAVSTSFSTLEIFGGSQSAGDEIAYTGGSATGAFPGNGTLTPTDVNAHAINYNSIEPIMCICTPRNSRTSDGLPGSSVSIEVRGSSARPRPSPSARRYPGRGAGLAGFPEPENEPAPFSAVL